MLKEKKIQIDNCLKNIAKGNTSYVNDLYDLAQANLYFIALRYLRDEKKAEDLLADFWGDIVKISKKYVFSVNSYSYLCKVLTNMALARLRKDKEVIEHEVQLTKEFLDRYETIRFDDFSHEKQIQELGVSLKKGFALLNNEEKKIIYLIFWEGKSIRECAKVMAISKSAAGRIKISAVKKLKTILEKDGWDKADL